MKLRVCMCCGEPIAEKENGLFDNPNMCIGCANLVDAMEEADLPEPAQLELERFLESERVEEIRKAA